MNRKRCKKCDTLQDVRKFTKVLIGLVPKEICGVCFQEIETKKKRTKEYTKLKKYYNTYNEVKKGSNNEIAALRRSRHFSLQIIKKEYKDILKPGEKGR